MVASGCPFASAQTANALRDSFSPTEVVALYLGWEGPVLFAKGNVPIALPASWDVQMLASK